MVKGRIHSIESMGLVDGPGIRTIVFMQGCKLRCAYCHNPDTWSLNGGSEMTSDEIVKKIIRFKPYFKNSGGGVTFSGGDPLFQDEFLLDMLKQCKQHGIHTAIDTAGYGHGHYDEILKYTDLVLLDIKHIDSTGYIKLTGQDTKDVNLFLEALRKSTTRVWVRHVIIPNHTDSKEHIEKIAKIINEEIPNVDKIELLPYHLLGVNKYEALGMKYKLEDVPAMDKEKTKELETYLYSLVDLDKTNVKVS